MHIRVIMNNEKLKFHVTAVARFNELGLMDDAQSSAELTDCAIGLNPCTFSVWVKRPDQLAYKGAWFELYRNEPAELILELWLMDEIPEDCQVRPFNNSQSDLCSKHNQLF